MLVFVIKSIFLLLKKDDICTLDNCFVTEICYKVEKYFLTCIYRSPSQSHDEFESFCVNFDLVLNNINDEFPLSSIVTGYINALCSSWSKNDYTNSAGQGIGSLVSSTGYVQMFDKPTSGVINSMSYKDLIFFTNENIISNHRDDVTIC